MIIDMIATETAIVALKEELGIKNTPHSITVQLWHFAGRPTVELECRVTVFTDPNHCEQVSAATFKDAFLKLKGLLRPKSSQLLPGTPLKVKV